MDKLQLLGILGGSWLPSQNCAVRRAEHSYAAGLNRTRIVCGKGTDALRRAIHRFLGSHPLVTSFDTADPEEVSAGATIVMIKET